MCWFNECRDGICTCVVDGSNAQSCTPDVAACSDFEEYAMEGTIVAHSLIQILSHFRGDFRCGRNNRSLSLNTKFVK
jgi:hypothetical protein